MTAQLFLRDIANIQSGQSVLVSGASGAVGEFGVQLGKYYRVRATGVSSGKNADLARSLGTDRVIAHRYVESARKTGAVAIKIISTANVASALKRESGSPVA